MKVSKLHRFRAKLAGYLYRLTKWVAPSWPEPAAKVIKTDTGYDWDDAGNFGERPY